MKNLTLAIVVAAASTVACVVLTSCEKARTTNATKWVTVNEEGRFTIDFPTQPTKTTQTGRVGAASPRQADFYNAEINGVAYLVAFSRVPDDTLRNFTSDEILDAARDGLLIGIDGRIEKELLITQSGFPGREVWCSIPHSSSKLTMLTRIYVAGDRKYAVGVTTGVPNGVFGKVVARFFESFRIKN